MRKEKNMSETRGGERKRKRFRWKYEPTRRTVRIINEHGRKHEYTVAEIVNVLKILSARFGGRWFPLANNVEKLGNGTERTGLGTTILMGKPRDTTHAQGASYLGVVMEECGYFAWNRRRRGIAWRLLGRGFSMDSVARRLQQAVMQPLGGGGKAGGKVKDHPAFGLWADRQDLKDVRVHVRRLRRGRFDAV
jgi:hypothetical protein